MRRRYEGDLGRVSAAFDVRVTGPVRDAILAGADPAVVWTFGERIDGELLARASSLRVVVNQGVGIDGIDTEALARHGVALVCATGANTEAVADRTFALLLAVRHRLVEQDALVRGGGWAETGYRNVMGADVFGTTLGIVGFGAVGRAVARRARGFGMHVLVSGRRPPSADDLAAHGVEQAPLDDVLGRADAVTLHCPLTELTRNLIGARELALLSPGAVLVNTARGGLVDEAALIAALADGRLAGAGLDVFAHEPDVPPALRAHPRVVLTPHSAVATPSTLAAQTRACVDGLFGAWRG
jgi:phosphoglycerate dehydrogenase-like enzyme